MNSEWIRNAAALVLAGCVVVFALGLGGCAEDGGKIAIVEDAYPGISMGLLKNAKLVKMKPEVLAEAGGAQFTNDQLQATIKDIPPEVLPQIQKNLIFLLEQRLAVMVLVKEAKNAGIPTEGISDDDTIQALLMNVAKDVTVPEEDVKAFFEANKAMIGETPFEEVKETIEAMLGQEKQQQAVNVYLEQLEQKADIKINRQWFEENSRLTRDNPLDKARFSDKPSLIGFGATGSLPSEMMQPTLDALQKKHPDTLNVVSVNLAEERVLGARYGIGSVPAQVFFDKTGKEVFRNMGVLAEEEIVKQLAGMGVN
jgi:thioredoxin 1